jgi:hypothetical protein
MHQLEYWRISRFSSSTASIFVSHLGCLKIEGKICKDRIEDTSLFCFPSLFFPVFSFSKLAI